MELILKHFEKYVSYVLMIIAMVFVCYQTWDLAYHFGFNMIGNIKDPKLNIEEKGRPVAGLFFSILLTLEIIQTIRVFSHDHSVKLRIILIVGLIAVTRKILMFDMEDVNPMSEFAIAALIIALSLGYYLVTTSEKSVVRNSDK
ncbi:phosphate-starvation-inducible PsiE family protein [Mucilaginibacter agri]|uniref:Phosphate-starvation-inducible E n=1 Tax=Mucilaginibacter agri TaxID=2695265 RepID=A0A965ZLU5_9SPHI|nr:phosphate-starvation-inducible PsiE family protein [Mucilaginibacter agri]NCD72358.1 hypothetical protein [Mucilaginibacter agri]